jgi:hypothetical protein
MLSPACWWPYSCSALRRRPNAISSCWPSGMRSPSCAAVSSDQTCSRPTACFWQLSAADSPSAACCSPRPPSCAGTGNWSAAAGWGERRIQGELLKLGCRISNSTVRLVLRRHRLGSAPRRSGPTWSQFLRAHARAVLACDFLTVDSVRLGVLYVLVFLEIGSRRVVFCNATAHPDSAWVAQQARNVAWELEELKIPIKGCPLPKMRRWSSGEGVGRVHRALPARPAAPRAGAAPTLRAGRRGPAPDRAGGAPRPGGWSAATALEPCSTSTSGRPERGD